MTANQIAFAKLGEEARHNLVSEGQQFQTIGENVRHNQRSEDINWFSTQSEADYKRAMADQGYLKLPIEAEKARASSVSAQAAQSNAGANWMNAETSRYLSGSQYALNEAKTSEAEAGATQALASAGKLNAETESIPKTTAVKEQEFMLKQSLQPYEKAKLVTETFYTAARGVGQLLSNIFIPGSNAAGKNLSKVIGG